MYKLKAVDVILQRLREPRKRIQVVAGPRQVGKTTSVGGQGMSLEEALSMSATDLL